MTAREQYVPGPASGAQVRKDGEKWTLILVRELRHSPEKVWQALTPIGRIVGPEAMKFGGWQRLPSTRSSSALKRPTGRLGRVKSRESGWCARSASGSPSQEVTLKWNDWVRQIHRWLSIAFTVTVIANFIALAQGGGMPPPWVTYSPLLPLALLLFTGLYLFALPYAIRWRSRRRIPGTSRMRT